MKDREAVVQVGKGTCQQEDLLGANIIVTRSVRASVRGKKKCACKDDYLGDGLTCEPEEALLDRCAAENGQCHPDAECTDLHFEGDVWLHVYLRGKRHAINQCPQKTQCHP